MSGRRTTSFPFFLGLVILYDSSFETEFLRGINGGSFSDIFEGERALMFFVPIMSGTLYEFP